ncbi:MAG: hypothetical protein P4L84_02040 [Isosphaeraceae bacterium]|nr:hypothetical protein [Isosphaeraceae bacterium]
MRLLVISILLGGTAALGGCGSTPHDPYSDMRMLTPEEAGVTNKEQDPVQEAEKAFNAKFVRKERRTR